MINLKIKTLDSRDHDFSVADDITVRQFKEHIVTKTGIAAEVQRLIYCGRVLVDDKPLNEYNVNGKVVHLVERQPPRTRPETRSESANGRRQQLPPDVASPILRTLDGMYMGAVTIPYTPMNGTGGVNPLNPSSTLCMNRITVARHMLTCAENIVNFLENPEVGLNNGDLDILAQHTLESTVFEVGISAVSDGDVPTRDVQNFVQAFQGAVSAAFRQNGMTNITDVTPSSFADDHTHTIVLSGSRDSGAPGTATTQAAAPAAPSFVEPSIPPRPESTTAAPGGGAARTRSQSERSTTSTRTPSSSTVGDDSASGTSTPTSQQQSASTSPSRRHTRTTVLADVVQQMRTVQTRMEPYIQQYYEILLNDPRYETDELRANSQRVFDRISEALHYMSHAQHAISDLMLDLSQEPVRHLSCRPILVEQSAYQSLIPIPRRVGIINGVMSLNGAGNNNETAAPNHNTPNAAATGPQVVHIDLTGPEDQPAAAATNQQQPMDATPSVPADTPPRPTAAGTGPAPAAAAAAATPPPTSDAEAANNQQASIGRLIQGLVNSVSLYSDLHLDMDMGVLGDAGGFAMPNEARTNDERPAGQPSTPVAATSSEASDISTSGTQTTRSAFTQAETPPTPTPASGTPRAPAVTFPTTSTQTRSTVRPQVHVTSLPPAIRPFQTPPFDRFLPCTSHHVLEIQDAHRQQLVHIHRRTPVRRAFATAGSNANTARSHSHNTRSTTPRATTMTITLTDLQTPIHLFNTSFSILEMEGVTPHVTAVNRNREAFKRYLLDTFGGDETTLGQRVYERLADHVRISNLREADSRPNPSRPAAAVLSVNNLLRNSIPTIVSLVLNEPSIFFAERFLREITMLFRRLYVLVFACAGLPDANRFFTDFISQALSIDNRREDSHITAFMDIVDRTIQCNRNNIRRNYDDIEQFFVIPLGTRESPATPMDTDESVSTDATPATPVKPESPQTSASGSPSPVIGREYGLKSQPPPSIVDPEPLPTVVYGNEPWHNGMPRSWVPTITRDIGRQRRTGLVAPHSDAYLSGMSSKRRKVITSTRPTSTNPTSLFNQGVRAICQSRNSTVAGSSRSTATAIEESAAAQPWIFDTNGPLERAFREFAQSRTQTDTDYDPERYPYLRNWTGNRK